MGPSDHGAGLTSGEGRVGGGRGRRVSDGNAISRKFWPGCWGVPQPKSLLVLCLVGMVLHLYPQYARSLSGSTCGKHGRASGHYSTCSLQQEM